MLGKSLKGVRKAEVTIEITLSIALSIVVLFLVLGLFSENLSTMAANSGLKNLFNRDNSDAKTAYNNWSTVNNRSDVEVQLVGDQGLEYYLQKANTVIETYRNNPPLTQLQAEEEARAIANKSLITSIWAIIDNVDGSGSINLVESKIRSRDKIGIYFNTGNIVLNKFGGASLEFDADAINYDSGNTKLTSTTLDTVKQILNRPFITHKL